MDRAILFGAPSIHLRGFPPEHWRGWRRAFHAMTTSDAPPLDLSVLLPDADPALLAEAARAVMGILEGRRVVRAWVLELPPKQQVSLLVALRGPDDGNEAGKELVRRLRYAVLHVAGKKESFMSESLEPVAAGDLEYGSLHFANHLLSAARKITKHHPDEPTRAFWSDVCTALLKLGLG